jgi:hypothetical protein
VTAGCNVAPASRVDELGGLSLHPDRMSMVPVPPEG